VLDDAHLAQPEEGRALPPQIGNIRFGAAAGATSCALRTADEPEELTFVDEATFWAEF
jgi:hypothetical protein